MIRRCARLPHCLMTDKLVAINIVIIRVRAPSKKDPVAVCGSRRNSHRSLRLSWRTLPVPAWPSSESSSCASSRTSCCSSSASSFGLRSDRCSAFTNTSISASPWRVLSNTLRQAVIGHGPGHSVPILAAPRSAAQPQLPLAFLYLRRFLLLVPSAVISPRLDRGLPAWLRHSVSHRDRRQSEKAAALERHLCEGHALPHSSSATISEEECAEKLPELPRPPGRR